MRTDRAEDAGRIRLSLGHTLTLVGVGAVAVGLLIALWWHFERAEQRLLGEDARTTAVQVSSRLQAWIEVRVSALDHAASQRDESGLPDAETFRERATHLVGLFPDLQVVNWVDGDDVIRLTYRKTGHGFALGSNLMQYRVPAVREALWRARVSGAATRTPVADLLSDGGEVAVFLPVRASGGTLHGFVNGVFQIDTLVKACLEEDRLQRDFRYCLEEGDRSPVYPQPGSIDYREWPHRADVVVQAVDRPWTLHMAPSEARCGEETSSIAWIVIVVGAIGATLFLLLVRGRQLRRAALGRSEALYRSLISDVLNASRVGIVILDAAHRIVWQNEALAQYFSLSTSDPLSGDGPTLFRQQLAGGVVEDPEAFVQHAFARTGLGARTYELHVLPRGRRKERWLEHRSQRIESGPFAGGRIDHFYDVTERMEADSEQTRLLTRERELQNQLRQSQRLEAVGKLAGGVAHDFNNILQVILGRASMLLMHAPEGSREAAYAAEVVEAGEKAAGLTRQLLAFGRRQHLERRRLDPNGLLQNHVKLLRRLIGEDVELELVLGEDVDVLEADATQLEQVLMNLCVNARDAMPDGGRITIATEACREIEIPVAEDRPVRPPEAYVKITVSDTGKGIPAAILDHICEPFYSTKSPGRGSGLGLSTVHGIVHQHDGFIEIESMVGLGTTISVYLPAAGEAEVTPSEARPRRAKGGTETILVVEDDPGVRSLAVESLGSSGYTVRTAADGEEALEVLLAAIESIDLVFSDVVMPRMGGVALVKAMRARGIDVSVILTSGYGEEVTDAGLGVSYLAKPYGPTVMLQRIREVLDALCPSA